MRKLPLAVAILTVALASAAFATPRRQTWPTVDQQLKASRVQPGTALEELILSNQDFQMLRAEEAHDKIQIPLWLRVWWRKSHPEGDYSAADPTGGYPRALREVAEWMMLHQDLVPDQADDARAPDADLDGAPWEKAVSGEKTTVGADHSISGSQTVPRNEPDIRINFWNTSRIIAASNNIGGSGQQAQYYSSDGGATWGQTFLGLQTGDSFHSDPAVDWTSDGTAWSTTIGVSSTGTTLKIRAYKSTNGGATWAFNSTVSGTQTNTDKEMIWADHSATSAFKDYLYACWHNGSPAYVNRRTGPTGSWGSPIKVSSTESTGTAIGCDVKTNSAGDAFVFWPATGNSRIVMAKSTNGGSTWGTPVVVATTKDSYDIGIPADASRRALIYASAGAYRTSTLDNVYVTWTDLTGATGCTGPSNEPGTNASSTCKTRIWFARSTDGGASWSTPVMINNQASLNDQFNQWMGVDETTGRIAVIYYDTAGDSTRQTTNVWYQTSSDNGTTWSAAVKLTTAPSGGCQYGDYNGLSIYAGKVLPAWTDCRNRAPEIWTVLVTEP